MRVRELAEKAGRDLTIDDHPYPFFYYMDDYHSTAEKELSFSISGVHVRQFLDYVLAEDLEPLQENEVMPASLFIDGSSYPLSLMHCGKEQGYTISLSSKSAGVVVNWLRALSDGFIKFDEDLKKKLPGPIIIKETEPVKGWKPVDAISTKQKPFFIGKVKTDRETSSLTTV